MEQEVFLYKIHAYGEEGEESKSYLIFDKKLTEKEFSEYFAKASRDAIEYAINNPKDFHWDASQGIELGEIYPIIIKNIIEKYGFKKIKVEGTLYPFIYGTAFNEIINILPDIKDLEQRAKNIAVLQERHIKNLENQLNEARSSIK